LHCCTRTTATGARAEQHVPIYSAVCSWLPHNVRHYGQGYTAMYTKMRGRTRPIKWVGGLQQSRQTSLSDLAPHSPTRSLMYDYIIHCSAISSTQTVCAELGGGSRNCWWRGTWGLTVEHRCLSARHFPIILHVSVSNIQKASGLLQLQISCKFATEKDPRKLRNMHDSNYTSTNPRLY